MLVEDEYFKRGLSFLNQSPPNFVKALSLIKKANKIYEQKGKIKEFHSSNDKIKQIYSSLSDRDLISAKKLSKDKDFKNSIIKTLDSINHLLESESRSYEKKIKLIKPFFESIVVEFLYKIERHILDKGYSEQVLSELSFIEKSYLEVEYPNLKDKTVKSSNFASMITSKKIMRAFINTYETIGIKSKEKASELIDAGNINTAFDLLETSKLVFEKGSFTSNIKELSKYYKIIYETQGDAEFTFGMELSENGRLNKARIHLKKARNYYKKSTNDKKVKLSERNYLKISMDIGNKIIADAEKALEMDDLKAALSYLEDAQSMYHTINHQKMHDLVEKKKRSIYKTIGEQEYNNAESLTIEELNEITKSLPDSSLDRNITGSISSDAELIRKKLQHYHDAAFYFRKANDIILARKSENKVEYNTKIIADTILNHAKKNIRTQQYEAGYINFKKSLFYYESINQKFKVKSIQEEIDKLEKKIDQKKLEKLQRDLNDIYLSSSDGKDKSGISGDLKGLLPPDNSDQLFVCKSCNEQFKSYFFDSIQEKCMNCRERLFCDECSKEIGANTVFMTCKDCNSVFCLECSDRVYDFVQKSCISCRMKIQCSVCGINAGINQDLKKCSECGKLYCENHWDLEQNLCNNCKKVSNCSKCGKESSGISTLVCDKCGRIFCEEHFDKNRKECVDDIKEEICAKCGTGLKIDDEAFKCTKCGFMYCTLHYNKNAGMCEICIVELENMPIAGVSLSEGSPDSTDEGIADSYKLELNALKPLTEKYNHMEILEPEELNFLFKHQINLPKDENRYLNFGESEDIMVILEDKFVNIGKPYVIIAPIIPITENSKYIGDLIKKLAKYIPDIPETIDTAASITNLFLYAVNDQKWETLYEYLGQTLLKPGLDIIKLMKKIYQKADIDEIEPLIYGSLLKDYFKDQNFIENFKGLFEIEAEIEINLFTNKPKIVQILKVFYNFYVGNVSKASDILSMVEIKN